MDAGVWVAYGLKDADRHYPQAKAVIREVVTRKIKGVVSLLSLLETMDVIRKRIVERTPRSILDSKGDLERRRFISQKSQEKYQFLIDRITEAVRSDQMLIVDFKGIDIGNVFTNCNDFLSSHFGDINLFKRCLTCGRDYEHYAYKGLGPIDTMHILLAREIGCNYFYTTDQSFKHLFGKPEFNSIRIEII